MTSGSATRDELVQLSRSIPRDVIGFASVGGFFIAIVGLAGLIISGVAAIGGSPTLFDWPVAAFCLVTGSVMMWWAGGVIGRRFVCRAAAAGYSPKQIREIEDEAERLNEKED